MARYDITGCPIWAGREWVGIGDSWGSYYRTGCICHEFIPLNYSLEIWHDLRSQDSMCCRDVCGEVIQLCVEDIWFDYRRSWDFIKSSVSSSRSVMSSTLPISAFSWNHTFALPLTVSHIVSNTLHTTVNKGVGKGKYESVESCVSCDGDVIYHYQRITLPSIFMLKLTKSVQAQQHDGTRVQWGMTS